MNSLKTYFELENDNEHDNVYGHENDSPLILRVSAIQVYSPGGAPWRLSTNCVLIMTILKQS